MTGLLLAAAGLVLFVRAPVGGSFAVDVLPSMILLGFGAGMALNPALLAALSDVAIVNTSFMMGGALGLAVLASLAASRSHHLLASGDGQASALVGGYHAAFLVGAIFAASTAAVGAALLNATGAPAPAGLDAARGRPGPRRPRRRPRALRAISCLLPSSEGLASCSAPQ